jgi:hypothetical protein
VVIGDEVGAGTWIGTGATMGKIEIVMIKDAGGVEEGMAVVAECTIEIAVMIDVKSVVKIGTTIVNKT